MAWLMAGLAVLAGLMLIADWYAKADVKALKRFWLSTGVMLAGIVLLWLALTGKLGLALAGLVGLGTYLMRLVGWVQLGARVFSFLNWRKRAGGQAHEPGQGRESPRARSTNTMTVTEAYQVLGLEPGATDEDVQTAYKRLMAKVHPDQGGSTYLAERLNAARDILLKN